GLLLVLSGPSGTGKTTLASRLLDRHGGPGQVLQRSISVTTRPSRSGEANGKDYLFVTEESFAGMEMRGELLETAGIYGYRYGTPRAFVDDLLARGVDILLILDAFGRQQIATTHQADLVSVFLLPPDLQALEQRLRTRSQDGANAIARRLAAAQAEIARCY